MKLAKVICIIGISTLAIAATACAQSTATAETEVKIQTAETETAKAPAETKAAPAETKAAAAETSEGETPELIGMPNPMVEIKDSSEFEKQLGIKIDASKLYDPNPAMYIIDGKMAHVVMKAENPNAQTVEYTLRATKDAEIAPMMHGIYDTLQDLSVKDIDVGGKTIKITEKETSDKKTQISTWQVGDTYYSLTITNSPSQMQIAEVMDSIWAATGLETANKN